MARWEIGRKISASIHKTIGLFVGVVVVLVGLSGSLLAFREDIDEWLNASMMRVDVPTRGAYRPLDEIYAAAVAAMPPAGRAERLTMPRHAGSAAAVAYLVETEDLDSFLYEMFVDPYTAKVTGRRQLLHGDEVFSQPLIQIVMAFHWTLLLGTQNAYLIGVVGISMFASVLAGLSLWPRFNGGRRLGLEVKWGASPERVAFDLHRSVGAYCAAFLLVMLATGTAMIFKPATRSVVSLFSPVRADPDFGKSTPLPDRQPIGPGEAAAIVDGLFPEGTLHWILMPSGPEGVYVVGKQSSDEPNRAKTFRNVGVDRYSGDVLYVQDRDRFTAGERILEWLFPLHSGEAFGALGRAVVVLVGATPLILFVTGILRWRHKRRARRAVS